jgi:dTDP-N-acetylfucosamine:lipid II N-acetylfucosaminyltransferase
MSDIRLLHIATDDKFLDYALPLFQGATNTRNSVWIIHTREALQLTKSKVDRVIDPQKLAQSDTSDFDAIILHSLRDDFTEFVLKQPAAMPILWIGWGFDYYDLIAERQSLLLPLTKQLSIEVEKSLKLRTRVKKFIDSSFNQRRARTKLKCIQRINFFAPVLSCEYELFSRAVDTSTKPKFIDWNYGTLEDQYASILGEQWVTGNDILIGNSATATCNHLDAIKTVMKCETTESQKVIAPLSYGDAPPAYKEAVSKAGHAAFGANFQPLTELMPLPDYLSILSNCGYVVMNHVRQQAMGNIISMLYQGSRIFLREDNPACRELRSRGFVINTIEELEASHELIRTPLTSEDRENNRKITRARWSRTAAAARTTILIHELTHGQREAHRIFTPLG